MSGSPPSSLFYIRNIIYAKFMFKHQSLPGGSLMKRSNVHYVHLCKSEKETRIIVLLDFLEYSTDGLFTGQDSQLTF